MIWILPSNGMKYAYPVDTGLRYGVESGACQITLGHCWSFSIFSLTRWPALTTWSVSGGQKVLNAPPVVRSVSRGAFRSDHAYWNVVSAGTRLVLQLALSCTERGSPYRSGFGLRTW